MGVNSLPRTVTRQRHDCDLNPGPTAPASSTLTTRLPSHNQCISLLLFTSVYAGVIFRTIVETPREHTHTLALPIALRGPS